MAPESGAVSSRNHATESSTPTLPQQVGSWQPWGTLLKPSDNNFSAFQHRLLRRQSRCFRCCTTHPSEPPGPPLKQSPSAPQVSRKGGGYVRAKSLFSLSSLFLLQLFMRRFAPLFSPTGGKFAMIGVTIFYLSPSFAPPASLGSRGSPEPSH